MSSAQGTVQMRRCGLKCVPGFLCVLGSLISLVYFMWHEPFLSNVVDLVEEDAKRGISCEQLSSAINPLSLPKRKMVSWKKNYFERVRMTESIMCAFQRGKNKAHALMKLEMLRVWRKHTRSRSSPVSKNRGPWVMCYSTRKWINRWRDKRTFTGEVGSVSSWLSWSLL